MRRLASVLIFAVLCVRAAAAVPDEVTARLDSLCDRYTRLISLETVEGKEAECDYLISTISDSLMRDHLACRLYYTYSKSRVMGDEAVAVYLWDKWFCDRKVNFPSEEEYLDARTFVLFNRNSLLGVPAPQLTLRRACLGRTVIPRPNRAAILFFYDTDCAKCKVETAVLPAVMKNWKVPVDFYAVYVGTDAAKWKAWKRSFKLGNGKVKLMHLWDPGMDSDFVREYGVLSTPKLFLIGKDGLIIGRRLEVENLLQLEGSL